MGTGRSIFLEGDAEPAQGCGLQRHQALLDLAAERLGVREGQADGEGCGSSPVVEKCFVMATW